MKEDARKGTLEPIAFTFCKCATVALVCGRFALPVAATLSAALYIAGYFKGERETRCFLGPPLAVAAFWVIVTAGWVVWSYFPSMIAFVNSAR